MTRPDTVPATQHTVIDPRSLGRPVHLLPAFADRFAADIGDFLRLGPNRRYGTALAVQTASMALSTAAAPARRWMVFGSAQGRIGVSIERKLVLRLLQCRYGLPQEAADVETTAPPVTASEERLARKLGAQLVTALVHRVYDGLQAAGTAGAAGAAAEASDAGADGEPEAVAWSADAFAAPGVWYLTLGLAEVAKELEGLVCFSLDEGWMRSLLGQLARTGPAPRDADGAEPLAARLKLRLVARLLQQRVSLGEVLALKVNDVLPVNLQTTDVLVKDSRLFTATVAEHKGRLWLTAFNDV
ncbi:MAG: fliM [Rhodoferax sp.]|nr:fliM [Rhodoferax sp.]